MNMECDLFSYFTIVIATSPVAWGRPDACPAGHVLPAPCARVVRPVQAESPARVLQRAVAAGRPATAGPLEQESVPQASVPVQRVEKPVKVEPVLLVLHAGRHAESSVRPEPVEAVDSALPAIRVQVPLPWRIDQVAPVLRAWAQRFGRGVSSDPVLPASNVRVWRPCLSDPALPVSRAWAPRLDSDVQVAPVSRAEAQQPVSLDLALPAPPRAEARQPEQAELAGLPFRRF